jgi:hypothetical protein
LDIITDVGDGMGGPGAGLAAGVAEARSIRAS